MGLLDLIGLFGSSVGAQLVNIGKIISVVVNGALALIGSLESVLQTVINVIKGTIDKITSALIDIWNELFQKWLVKLITVIRNIRDKIQHWLAPLIKQIQIIRQQQQLVFKLYIQPILNFISRMRQALLILRLFHLKFAQQLDQDLATIEGKIGQAVIDMRGQLNQILGYINIILDPFGNLQYGLYIKTALSSIWALFNALHAAQDLPLGAKDQAQQSIDAHSLDAKSVQATVELSAQTGLQPSYKADMQAVYQELESMGYPALPV